jgi:hypothetical protein
MTNPIASDMPDDYVWLPGSYRFPLADLGEFAARLGSPVVYDRRGEVIFYDTIANGLAHWNVTGSGLANDVLVSSEHSLYSGYSLYMTPGSNAGQDSGLYHWLATPLIERMGLEVEVAFPQKFNLFSIRFNLTEGATLWSWQLAINETLHQITVMPPTGIPQGVLTIPVSWEGGAPSHMLKLVCDCDAKLYTRLIYDDTEVDLHMFGAYPSPTVGIPSLYAYILQNANDGLQPPAILQAVIITANEP